MAASSGSEKRLLPTPLATAVLAETLVCTGPPSGLVGWWPGDGSTTDLENGSNGTLQNGATFAGGEVGQAFSLMSGGRVSITDAPSLRISSLTIEGWVNFSSTAGFQTIFAKTVGSGFQDSYAVWYVNGTLNGETGTANTFTQISAPWAPTVGTWYHVAYTFNGGCHALYLNGVRVASDKNATIPQYDAHPAFIGADTENEVVTFFFAGQIDELSLYNRALAPTEIQTIYNAGSAGKCKNAPPTTVQFNAPNYSVTEGLTAANITVTRAGDVSGVATIDYATTDGLALQRTDYSFAAGTLTFASAESSKTFAVLISEDAYVEGDETLSFALSNPTGGLNLGSRSTATLTITDNDSSPPTTNPIDDAATFVGQQYHDFLSRGPDQAGSAYWTNQITQCNPTDQLCIHNRRVAVADAFFFEPEFQDTGAFVYRVYKVAFGSVPTFAQLMPDRVRVIGGSQLDQSKADFANAFVQNCTYITRHSPFQTAAQYVDALNANAGNSLAQSDRDALVNGLNGGTETRGSVLRKIADYPAFIDREYNTSFVLTQYFGHLRRDPDVAGFNFWLGQMNRFPIRDLTIQHAMVCSFITSAEYEQRFSSVVSHNNSECL
jgi:hypothetical protein